MLFGWLRKRRRRRLLAEPFPTAWARILAGLSHYRLLDAEEQARLRDLARLLIVEKHWEGCGGLTLTDEMRVTVAAHAALLVLAFADDDAYPGLSEVLLYPSAFRVPHQRLDDTGVVTEGGVNIGEAWHRSAVVLAWDASVDGAADAGDGTNVILHEFAHQLDMASGWVDGTPPLRDKDQARRWAEVMEDAYDDLLADTEDGVEGVLDPYGTTDEGEFFAVATESFFEDPLDLAAEHPDLYTLLREYYRQDPAARVRRAERAS